MDRRNIAGILLIFAGLLTIPAIFLAGEDSALRTALAAGGGLVLLIAGAINFRPCWKCPACGKTLPLGDVRGLERCPRCGRSIRQQQHN